MPSSPNSSETGDGAPDMAAEAALAAMVQVAPAHKVVPVVPDEVAIFTCMTVETRRTTDGSLFRRTSLGVSKSTAMGILLMGMGGIKTVERIGRSLGRACKSIQLKYKCGLMDADSLGLSPFLREKLIERLKLEEAALE